MADRLTLEERRVVASLMEVVQSATEVRRRFAERFPNRQPPTRLTIYRIYQKFVATGSVADNYHGNAGRPRTGRSEVNIATVQEAILRSPSKSTRRCSLETGIPQRTVNRILSKDLGMRPYHLQIVQALTARQKKVRVACCEILAEMSRMQPGIVSQMIFSDEATFHTSGHVNRHNTIFWGTENPRIVREHERASPKVNVWCAVTATGVLGPYFFTTQTVNADDYLQMLKEFAIDNMSLQLRQEGYFQHDGAPPHFACTVRAYLDQKFPRRWIGRCGPLSWPPHSPDLTPCDFWLWGMIKERVYSTKVRDLEELKDRIKGVISNISPEMCVLALNCTVERWFECINRAGGQVETLYNENSE